MKKNHKTKRKDYPDSKLMEALDTCDYNLHKAAQYLGILDSTFRNWILTSDNLNVYMRHKQAEGAVRAREKLEYMLDNLDPLDPRQAGILKDVCKTLLDKYEPDLSQSKVDTNLYLNPELDKKIKELLGDG